MFSYGEIVKLEGNFYDYVLEEDKDLEYMVYFLSSRMCTIHTLDRGKSYTVPFRNLQTTGKFIEYGKHPFKEFYENKIDPDSLPGHTLSDRLVEFFKVNSLETYKHVNDLEFYWPNLDDSSLDFIWFWPNAKARLKGKAGRQKIKPGRFIRMLFEQIKDHRVEYIVEKFKVNFQRRSYEPFFTKNGVEMAEVYTGGRCPDLNFLTSRKLKRLCDSCMGKSRSSFGTSVHPVSAYGSGDWTLFWVQDQEGNIGARVLSYSANEKHELGPIYSTSNAATEALIASLPENRTEVGDGYWEGAKILKIKDGNSFVGPYLDLGSNFREVGKYLVVDEDGPIEHDHTGYYNSGIYCSCCEGYFSETTYVDSVGYDVCEGCLRVDFFVSHYDGKYYNYYENYAEVFFTRDRTEMWTRSQAETNAVWSEEFSQWLDKSCAVKTFHGEYIPDWYLGNDWFLCSEDGLAYVGEDTIEYEGNIYAKCNTPEGSEYYRCNETEDMIGNVA